MDHWLDTFPRFWPDFADFLGASGPLFKVGHWLGAFPDFWQVFADFLGASGPLDGVDHWLGAFPSFCPGFGGCLERFLAMAATYLRGFAG